MHHSKPLCTGYADYGIPLKGRSPKSLEQVQVHRVQIQNCASDLITEKLNCSQLYNNHILYYSIKHEHENTFLDYRCTLLPQVSTTTDRPSPSAADLLPGDS